MNAHQDSRRSINFTPTRIPARIPTRITTRIKEARSSYTLSRALLCTLMTLISAHAWGIPTRATHTASDSLTGAWMGHYTCQGERHSALLQVSEGYRGELRAIFHALHRDAEYLSFTLTGEVMERRKTRLTLSPERWILNPDDRFSLVGLRGETDGDSIRGRVDHPRCGAIELRRLGCDLTPSSPCRRRARGAFASVLTRDGALRARRPVEERRGSTRRNLLPPRRSPLSESEFSGHLSAVKQSAFDQGRLDYLRGLSAEVYLSVAQAEQLLKALSFDPKRIIALGLLAPRLTDHIESFLLLSTFTFGKYRAEAREILSRVAHEARERADRSRARSRRRSNRGAKRALTSQTFAVLMGQLREESFDKGKLSVLTLVCEMGYFTSRQALEIIKLWSFDEGRLLALRALAPRLIDLDRRAELVGMFSFESNRNQARAALGR